jgi:hypothetical protein
VIDATPSGNVHVARGPSGVVTIGYNDVAGGATKLASCVSTTCAPIPAADFAADELMTDLAVDGGGHPVVAMRTVLGLATPSANDDALLVRCGDASCTTSVTDHLATVTSLGALVLAIDPTGAIVTVISSKLGAALDVVRCGSDTCGA